MSENRAEENEFVEKLREKLVEEVMENNLHKFLGFEVVELNEEHSLFRARCTENTYNPYGFVHGGVLLTFADAAAGTTACMSGKYVTTVNANMNFLLPADHTEYIYCESSKLRRGTHLAVYDVRIKDDRGRVLDSGEFTFFITPHKVLE